MNHSLRLLGLSLLFFSCQPNTGGPQGDPLDHTPDQEGYYYQKITLPIPGEVILEVGGMDLMPDGRLAVSTRRGEIYFVDGIYDTAPAPVYHRFASGLHEPLGLLSRDGAIYATQRGELTKMVDQDGDDTADVYETVYAWPLTGNYHEYSYGPLSLPNGNFFVSLNLAWIGYGAAPAKWRGWALEISPEGEMTPMAVGFRSPAGIGITEAGDIFYGENQGDWIGSGWISHIEAGDFLGHPGGLVWTDEPGSPLDLKPEDIPNTGAPMIEAAQQVAELKLPTVWFPHTIMGISTSAIIEDNTGGGFGPFAGHLLVGDQGHSKLMRVFLEKVNGVYQGVNFPFYEGFDSGILRASWGEDNTLFVGQTSRGWDATGKSPYALERLLWTGNTPFEMHEVRARPDGFEISFTEEADPAAVGDPSNYQITSFTYQYHNTYGSPAINVQELNVHTVDVSEAGRVVRLGVEGLRAGYVHEIKLKPFSSATGSPLLHDVAYYTLNNIPEGESLTVSSPSLDTSGNGESSPKMITEMPDTWNGEADVQQTVATMPGLLFDTSEITVNAGDRVALTFNNDDDMLHNLVITLPGMADEVGLTAMNLGITGESKGYVPDTDQVLYHTGLLQPETQQTIYFTAPEEAGVYEFVCTFPGHAMTMRGTLIVQG